MITTRERALSTRTKILQAGGNLEAMVDLIQDALDAEHLQTERTMQAILDRHQGLADDLRVCFFNMGHRVPSER